MPRRARRPSVRSATPRETASEGRTRVARRPVTLELSAGVCARLARVRFVGVLALPSETARVAAVIPDVVERAVATRCAPDCAPRCGDSLYSGEERLSGEPRLTGEGRIATDAVLARPYRTTPYSGYPYAR